MGACAHLRRDAAPGRSTTFPASNVGTGGCPLPNTHAVAIRPRDRALTLRCGAGTSGWHGGLPAQYGGGARRLRQAITGSPFDGRHASAGVERSLDDSLGHPRRSGQPARRSGFAVGIQGGLLVDRALITMYGS